jgi:hypothetical protein
MSRRKREKEISRIACVALGWSLQAFLLKVEDKTLHLRPQHMVLLIKAGEVGSIPGILFITSAEACLRMGTGPRSDQEESKA